MASPGRFPGAGAKGARIGRVRCVVAAGPCGSGAATPGRREDSRGTERDPRAALRTPTDDGHGESPVPTAQARAPRVRPDSSVEVSRRGGGVLFRTCFGVARRSRCAGSDEPPRNALPHPRSDAPRRARGGQLDRRPPQGHRCLARAGFAGPDPRTGVVQRRRALQPPEEPRPDRRALPAHGDRADRGRRRRGTDPRRLQGARGRHLPPPHHHGRGDELHRRHDRAGERAPDLLPPGRRECAARPGALRFLGGAGADLPARLPASPRHPRRTGGRRTTGGGGRAPARAGGGAADLRRLREREQRPLPDDGGRDAARGGRALRERFRGRETHRAEPRSRRGARSGGGRGGRAPTPRGRRALVGGPPFPGGRLRLLRRRRGVLAGLGAPARGADQGQRGRGRRLRLRRDPRPARRLADAPGPRARRGLRGRLVARGELLRRGRVDGGVPRARRGART